MVTKWNFFIFLLLSILYMEFLLRLKITDQFLSLDLIHILLFSMTIALTLFAICSFVEQKARKNITMLALIILSVIYTSQFIYYDFFRTIFTMYSAGNGAQILDFWKDIALGILTNLHWVILFFLPVLIFLLFSKKLMTFNKIKRAQKIIILSSIISFYLIGLATIYAGGKDQFSAFDLYYETSYPMKSLEKLGLLTTMRIDFQRLSTGWAPVIEASSPYEEDIDLDLEEENNSEEETTPKQDDVKEEPVIIEYNTLPIDFDQLIANETDADLKTMHEFFESVPPTPKNEFTGIYEGYNLILITAEGFSSYAVNEEVTPTLYKLANEGYKFTNFYNPIWEVSTSDGEYVANTSLVPKHGVWSFFESGDNAMPFAMGNQLNKLGYKSMAYHNHSYKYYKRHISHPNMGYDYKGVGNGLNVKKTWPESDLEMMELSIPDYIDDQPFHAYYMTVSGHMQYNFFGNQMAMKNKKYVENLPYSDAARAYLATQVELDRALEHLLTELEEKGIADKTLIALSADHYPYGLENEVIDELAGKKVERNFDLYKSTFILYTKNMEPITIEDPISSLDILPTLSNLMGLDYDSRLLMGRDVFSESDSLVFFLNKSFITDKGRYNTETQEFIGDSVTQDYIDHISDIVESKFYYSAKILDRDYYQIITDELDQN